MDKKKKIIIILSILVVLVLSIFIFLFLFKEKEEDYEQYEPVDETEITFLKDYLEVYENVNLSDVISLNNNTEIIDDYKINTSELGVIKLYIKYMEDGKEKKKYTSIKIVDSTPPYIGIGEKYSHIINTNFTFAKDVLCADNYDKNVTCEIVGDYDLTKIGENKVKVIAKDSSGNVTEKDFSLNVIEKPKNTNNTTDYKKLEDIVKEKPENASILIDVSKWQANIDWEKVKNAGIDYAMLRLGTQQAIDKGSVLDTYFVENIKNAQENGIKVGVYYYSYANDKDDAKEQAEWVIEQLKDYKLDLPVAFDWECWKYFNEFNISLHDLNEIARTFLKTVDNSGFDVINYGSKNYMENIWDLNEYQTWLAHYTDKTDYSKEYIIWQFTDAGIIPGISGNVDVNYYFNK